jgi:hypothetical protein
MEENNNQSLLDELNDIIRQLENRKDGYVSEDSDYWSFIQGLDAAIGVVEWKIHLLTKDDE